MSHNLDKDIHIEAQAFFRDDAKDWLNTPNSALDGMTPVQAVAAGQANRVMQVLTRIQYGVYE